MKLDSLLEAMIKLPRQTTAEVQKFVVYWYLAALKGFVDESRDPKLERMYQNACTSHGIYVPSDKDARWAQAIFSGDTANKKKTITVPVDMHSLPAKYKTDHVIPDVKVSVYLNEPEFLGDAVAEYSPGRHELAFSLRAYFGKVRVNSKTLPHFLITELAKLIGLVEHEVTHLVQFSTIGLKSDKQTSMHYDGDNIDFSKYYKSEVEFYPMIRSALAAFMAEVRPYITRGLALSTAIGSFTGANAERYLFTKPHAFFATLKDEAPVRWKRAVKAFTAEAERRVHEERERAERKRVHG